MTTPRTFCVTCQTRSFPARTRLGQIPAAWTYCPRLHGYRCPRCSRKAEQQTRRQPKRAIYIPAAIAACMDPDRLRRAIEGLE